LVRARDGTLGAAGAGAGTLQRIVASDLVARADAGAVTGSNVPTQQFLEVGGGEALPGYEYKEFAGSQALIVRSTAAYLLPIFESPMRLGRVVLPAIAPQLQIGMFWRCHGGHPTDAIRARTTGVDHHRPPARQRRHTPAVLQRRHQCRCFARGGPS
jgi:hypothetical protein